MSTPSSPSSLALLRQARGWSQAELAERGAVSRTEVSGIETGRLVPSVAVALRLAGALDTSVEALFAAPGRSADVVTWAWAPRRDDPRAWRATVGGRVLAFPVEDTAAGALPHDAVARGGRFQDVAAPARPDRTLVVAGCDPIVGLIVQRMAEQHDVRVIPLLRSSAAALSLLRQGLVHVAGVHLSDASGRPQNDRVVARQLGRGHRLLHQLRWESGVAVAADRRERDVAALLRANLRWVNREEGSAARQAFDVLLGDERRPKGYGHVVRDHRAVAATVASGWADAGICVRPVAADAELGFIPLQRESYELCLPEALVDDPRVVALTATLQSSRYRSLVADVPGCSSVDTGELRVVA